MAVGKVGSFATVQPAIVDFGGMAQNAFKQIKEDEDKKKKEDEALKEKKRQEIEKIGGIGGLKSTNIKGFNQGLYNAYEPLKRKFAEAKASGDTSKMREIQEQVFSFNNIVDAVNKQYQFILNEKDKLDPVYVARFENAVNNIDIANMDVSVDESGRIGFTLYEDAERTKPMFVNMQPNEILDNLSQIPYAFDEVGYVKEFTKTYPLSKIEELIDTKGLIGTSGKSLLKEDKSVQDAINSQAKMLSNDSKALAYFGARELNKFDTDPRLWSDEDKKKAEDYYRKSLENAYAEKIDLSIQQRRSGSGRGKSDAPTIGSVQRLPQVGNLTNVLFAPIIASGASQAGVEYANGLKVVGLTYDPTTRQMYPTVPSAVGSSSTIGSRTSGNQGNVGAGTSSKDIQGDNITSPDMRFSTLARIATSLGYNDWTEMQQKLFGSLPSEATQQQSTQATTTADPLGILDN